jgi:dipeptidase E
VAERHIVGLGGGGPDPEATRRLLAYAVGVGGATAPKIAIVPTAVGDDAETVLRMYDLLPDAAAISYVPFFPWPPERLREIALAQDAIFVCGGNTANMLGIWRVHGFDRILHDAWQAGVVLTGWSAGMICWFEAGVTDSFGPQLEGMRDGLGFLPGSACPHYDGEERRRPVYAELARGDFPAGIAADDGVGVHFRGTDLEEVVTVRDGATAYRVAAGGETALEARVLD